MSMGSIGVDDCSVVVVDVDDCVLVVVSVGVGVAMVIVVESFVVAVGAIDFFMGVFFPPFFWSLGSTPPHLLCWGFLGDFRCFWWVTCLL